MSTHEPDPQATPDPDAPPTPPAAAAVATSRAEPPARTAPTTEQLLAGFARDYLRDRRSERRWRIFFRASWLLIFVALAWLVNTQNQHSAAPNGPHTALVELRGEIASDTEASAEFMLSGLRDAFADAGARAVVIRINSPGGSPVQAGIINDEIRRLKAKHDKKVYAVVEESCASGAYYVAVAADEIYVDKASIVGSIGVLMDGFGFDQVMAKVGVQRRLLTAGENKAMLDPYSPLSDKHRALAQDMLDQIHRQFIDTVRAGRGKRLKETPDTFSGLFWNGEEAVRLGLADALGNLDYVAREVVKAEEIIDYTPKENVAERLAKRFGAAMGESATHALRSLPAMR
ncbi:protease-4 [Sphaerotilus hippei]|uniref:Protease-4 n=1 Tax=Sphaerotilus hippei TaxID=744406 RepID=A0A318H1V2_9BURK|nr:S49 family peptidase [Sphaerotilus hippei]PXW97022.1 protease-4 [Sphaerotilus hippei]